MEAANDNDVFLTPREVAARYGGSINVRTLANWRCQNLGPRYTKIGGRVLYPLAEVKRWEAARTFGDTSQYRRSA